MDVVETFPLYSSKKGAREHDTKAQVVGWFKGAIKVYPLPDAEFPPPSNALSYTPSSKPVQVIVRVYIIRVSFTLIAIINYYMYTGYTVTASRCQWQSKYPPNNRVQVNVFYYYAFGL